MPPPGMHAQITEQGASDNSTYIELTVNADCGLGLGRVDTGCSCPLWVESRRRPLASAMGAKQTLRPALTAPAPRRLTPKSTYVGFRPMERSRRPSKQMLKLLGALSA